MASASASSQPGLLPVSTDFLNNGNVIEVDRHLKNMSSTLEQMMNTQGSLSKNMSDTLEQILDVLKGSTIAEERGIDDNSKFWATYKKVSTEYDNDFLGRANDDMGIILTFAGLFSAVNSTFIVGMQPNPGDTTNALLLRLIQITVNGTSAVSDINTLSSSTGFASSTVWMQTLAYASLAFSVLAAFGAVMGKQWLNSYKSVRGRALEERGIERQIKLDGVEYFRLKTFLRAFLVLLQISLLLFGLSLSANMWLKQTTISSIIMSSTAIGILFYAGTMVVSVFRPDSPFQTPGSKLIAAICQKFHLYKPSLSRDTFTRSSAIRWILETSTNPEIVEAAAMMIPRVEWSLKFNASAAFARLRDNFIACRDDELYVKYGKIMTHLCIQSIEIDPELLLFPHDKFSKTRHRFICDALDDGRVAYDRLKNTQGETRSKYQADARTALRKTAVYGLAEQLSRPNDENLIWKGDLQWLDSHELAHSCKNFDWLVDYLAGDAEDRKDDETQGDALLVLRAMQGLGSPDKQWSYISSLIRCMQSTRSTRVRHAALQAAFGVREQLASMPPDVATRLDEFSRALLTAVCPKDGQTTHNTGPDASFHVSQDTCYIHIIYALTKKDEWCRHLTRDDGHPNRCISLVNRYHDNLDIAPYLLVVFGRMKSLSEDLPFKPEWRRLIGNVWDPAKYSIGFDVVDGIPALVTATRLKLIASHDSVPRVWFPDVAANVHATFVKLQKNQAEYLKNGIAQAAINAALSSIRGLDEEMSRIVKQRNPP